MAASLWLFNFIEIGFVCFIIVQAIETTNPKKKSVEQANPILKYNLHYLSSSNRGHWKQNPMTVQRTND